MRAAPRPRHALALASVIAAAGLTLLDAACARARREGAWVDTTPNGFVAAPVDPPADAGALDAGALDAASPDASSTKARR